MGVGATAVLSGKFRLSASKYTRVPAPRRPQVHSGYQQRQGLGSHHSLVDGKLSTAAMYPERTGALGRRKLNKWSRAVSTCFRGLSRGSGDSTDTFEFEEEQNGEGKEEGPGAEGNLPGWLPRGLWELFLNPFS